LSADSNVIACDKREAFAQGSNATKQSRLRSWQDGLLRWRSQWLQSDWLFEKLNSLQ
jgi:hypothetical protein